MQQGFHQLPQAHHMGLQNQMGGSYPRMHATYQHGIQQHASVLYPLAQEQIALQQQQFPALQFQQQAIFPEPEHHHQQIHGGIVTRDEGWYPEIFKDRIKLELDLKDIEEDLTTQNYKKKFNCLVCWEEKSNIEILGKK